MKNLLIALALMTLSAASAQEDQKPQRDGRMERLTPDQRNQLQLKKMTLDLGLNDSQQKEVSKIIAEQSTRREAALASKKANREKGIRPSAQDRYASQNQMLDDQIAVKEQMKKVLTKEQFEKWDKMREEKMAKHGERRGRRRIPQNDRK